MIARALIVGSMLLAATAGAESRGRLGVIEMQQTGLEPEVVALLTDRLVSILAASGVFSEVVSTRDMQAMLAFEAKQQLAGCDTVSCFAELAGALGVDRLLTATIGQLGQTSVVNLTLIDLKRASTEMRVSREAIGDAGALLAAVTAAVNELIVGLGGTAVAPAAVVHAEAKGESGGGIGTAPLALWGVGVVSLGVGIGFGVWSSGLHDLAVSHGVGSQAAIGTGQTAQIAADVAFGVAIAAALGGLGLWLMAPDDRDDSDTAIAAAPVLLDGGFGLTLGGRF